MSAPDGTAAVRARWGSASWTLATDGATGLTHSAACTTCPAASGAHDGWVPVQDWCVAHTGRAGHTRFHTAVTGVLVASPTDAVGPGNPQS